MFGEKLTCFSNIYNGTEVPVSRQIFKLITCIYSSMFILLLILISKLSLQKIQLHKDKMSQMWSKPAQLDCWSMNIRFEYDTKSQGKACDWIYILTAVEISMSFFIIQGQWCLCIGWIANPLHWLHLVARKTFVKVKLSLVEYYENTVLSSSSTLTHYKWFQCREPCIIRWFHTLLCQKFNYFLKPSTLSEIWKILMLMPRRYSTWS